MPSVDKATHDDHRPPTTKGAHNRKIVSPETPPLPLPPTPMSRNQSFLARLDIVALVRVNKFDVHFHFNIKPARVSSAIHQICPLWCGSLTTFSNTHYTLYRRAGEPS